MTGRTSGPSAAASTPRWHRCLTTTAFSCGCPRSGAGSTSPLRITRRRCWRCVISPSGRSPAPGSVPRWPRPASKAATSAATRPAATGSPTPGRTRTKAHAAWGRRAHRLKPDPETAPAHPYRRAAPRRAGLGARPGQGARGAGAGTHGGQRAGWAAGGGCPVRGGGGQAAGQPGAALELDAAIGYERETVAMLFGAADAAEGFAAFRGRRPASFSGP